MPELTKAQKIRQRVGQLVTARLPYEDLWQDIADLVAPRRADLAGTDEPGKKRGVEIYDGTARSACQQMADGFYGYLCSPSMEWFRLMMARKGLNDLPEVKAYLQECEEQLYYAFNRSNFYAVVPQYFYDGGSIGTATMYCEEDLGAKRLIFMLRHPREIFISTNRYDEVDMIARKYKMTARNAFAKFGDKLSDKIVKSAETSPEAQFDFLHMVYPNEDKQLGKVDASGMPFTSVYLEDTGPDTILLEGGYHRFPFMVWRYRVDSGEVYGRSAGGDAIVDTFGANQVSKTMLQAAQLAVEPAYNVPKEMRGHVRIKPRGMNYYEDKDRTITPVHTPTNSPAGEAQLERLHAAIEKNFHTEFFMLLSRAALEGRQLTVPQVMEMQGEKGAMLGAVVGRLNGDFFDNVIDRVFQLEHEAGRMPDVPDVLLESGEANIDVEYMGPLAQAQKQLTQTQGITRGIESLAPLAEMFPEVRDRIIPDVVAEELLDSFNFPQKAIRPLEEANAIREARAAQEQQMAQMEMMAQAVDKVPALAKSIEPDSVLGKVEEGA